MHSLQHVRSADGTSIAVRDAGHPNGMPLVLVHGIAQSHAAWDAVFEGPLARTHRLVAMDLRGHGASDAPASPESYTSGTRLGEDLHAVMTALRLSRPVLVPWSYGGVAVGEYLRTFGSSELGGVLLVAAAIAVGRDARAWFGPVMMDNARALMSTDRDAYEAGARAFLSACMASAPHDPSALESSVRAMMGVPAHARRALLTRNEDFTREYVACEAPIGAIHGARDPVVLPALTRHLASLRADLGAVEIAECGHVPWVEAPDRFTAAVDSFVRRCAER
jgi:pimeloyl-ACP methyl ester carboxylesterase